jgi:hypothetical protein
MRTTPISQAPKGWTPDPQRHVIALPRTLVIDGVVHVRHYHSQWSAVYQNYSKSGSESVFKVYRIEVVNSEETLGVLLATAGWLGEAIRIARKEGPQP